MSGLFKSKQTQGEHWISISDMMSGLMMVFLFIAVSYMLIAVREKERIKEIAVTYNHVKDKLYAALENEFRDDLPKWNATIDRPSLSLRFKSPDVLFEKGEYVIKPEFRDILADFFPRYVSILTGEEYRNEIVEIRIEGHTSSEWHHEVPENLAYLLNMELSQNRTRSVLNNVLSLQDDRVSSQKIWLKKFLTANGLSSSKPIMNGNAEDRAASRRVEFRVRTNAEQRIEKIIRANGNEPD
jgi:outer membrane protein OmpA-like peptidoglycan-associated protein